MNSKKQKHYTAVLIGAGRIASTFDVPKSKMIRTHAHALSANSHTTLLGLTDINHTKGKHEAKKWKTSFYSSVDELLLCDPDIVVIATPNTTHARLLERISLHRPRLIICEKPAGLTLSELNRLEKKVLPLKVLTLVNFSRHFDPAVRKLREELKSGVYGRILSANVVYTNGVLHNGSHVLDLCRFLFGELKTAKGFFVTPDHGKTDPSIGGVATFERCKQFSIMTGDERAYAVLELEIFAEKKRIRLSNFGFEIVTQDVIPDPRYKGFMALGKQAAKKTGLEESMDHLYAHALAVLDNKEKPMSTLAEAIKTQRACLQFLHSL